MNRTFRIIFMISLAVALAGTGYGRSAAQAADPFEGTTITVTTQSDNADADGWCSLREAIINANGDIAVSPDCPAGSGNDTIVFADEIDTITLMSTLPTINDIDGLTIDGGGDVVLSGDDAHQILSVSFVSLEIESITFKNASDPSGWGGAILNRGTLTITTSFVTNSSADRGGGIYNSGTLFITKSAIGENSASSYGGAIYNQGTLTLNESWVAGNGITGPGGGGSGIHNVGTMTITNSTFDLNYGNSLGSIYNSGSGTITNSTLYQNTSNGPASAGAIFNDGALTVTNNTFYANESTGAGDIYQSISSAELSLYNNIMIGNAGGGNCVAVGGTVSGKNNLVQDPSTACGFQNGINGNIVGSDHPVVIEAGYPRFFSLGHDSPAIDAGDDVHCPATDQRGLPRPQGEHCDMGAFEMGSTTITVSTEEDDTVANGLCSLREAILNANGDDAIYPDCPAGSGNDIIVFGGGVHKITLSSELPAITDIDGLSIIGAEMTHSVINGGEMHRILTVQAPLTMKYMALISGRSAGMGGAIYNDYVGVLMLSDVTLSTNNADQGGAIYNAGVLISNNSHFGGNQAALGGAIYNDPLGSLTMNDSTFAYNYAENAGGALFNSGIMTVTGTTFYGNDATGGGGAISNGNGGSGTVINGLFYENSSYQTGGAILNSADLTVINSTFSENDSISGGGADIHHSGFNTLHLYNNIMANSQDGGGNCIVDAISGPPVVGSHNLIEDAGSTCGLTDGVDGNIVGVDPNLGTFTEYIRLNEGSAAINAGSDAHCPATDQRGVTRPQGEHCDMGSYEYAEGLPPSATFADVPLDYWAWENVEILYAAGITGGCTQTPLNYCPEQAVTRAQMAIFLLRGIHGPGYTPPPATGGEFSDVPANAFGAAWIEQLVEEGITAGCGGGKYCPNGLVTRAQMAIFLLRAKHAGSYTPPPATGGEFSDVPANAFAAAWIEQLVEEGITAGCGGGKYCPNGSVTRAQMAVFLVRTFDLQP